MSISEAIISIMTELEPIAKTRDNPQQHYKFRGVDDVMRELNPLLVKYKVFPVPAVVDMRREERASKSGGVLFHTILTVKYTFTSAEDGSSICVTTVGEGMDSGDKSANKAMSAAYKYAMLHLFCIPTAEAKDSEGDSPEPQYGAKSSDGEARAKGMRTVHAQAKELLGWDHDRLHNFCISLFPGMQSMEELSVDQLRDVYRRLGSQANTDSSVPTDRTMGKQQYAEIWERAKLLGYSSLSSADFQKYSGEVLGKLIGVDQMTRAEGDTLIMALDAEVDKQAASQEDADLAFYDGKEA